MNEVTPRKLLLAGVAGIALLVLLVVGLMRLGQEPETSSGTRLPAKATQESNGETKTQKLPSGIKRPLSVDIPLIGRIHGSRWIPDHAFKLLPGTPLGDSKLKQMERPMDVLVDAEGRFIAARINGTRFATTPPEVSLERLLGEGMPGKYWNHKDYIAQPPAVLRVARAKVAYDDPRLGHALKSLWNDGFYDYSDWAKMQATIEETFLLLEVWYEGRDESRLVAVRRFTDGLTKEQSGPYKSEPDPGAPIRGSNLYGAYVKTRVRFLDDPKGSSQAMHLMEPWDGPCPWPVDRLDVIYGTNRLDEHIVPAEYYASSGDPFHSPSPRSSLLDDMRARGEARKAARLAAEAAAAAGGPK